MLHVDPASIATRPAPAGAPAPAAPSPARAFTERQLAMLDELAEIGMEIARAAGRQAATPATPADAPAADAFRGDPGLAYTRAARAVRMTIALQAQLLKDLPALEKAEAKDAYDRDSRRRIGVQRLVGEALAAERPDAAAWEFEQLSNFTRERLRDGVEEADLLGRPFAEIVARLCGDLGLSAGRTAELVAAAAAAGLIPAPPPLAPDPFLDPAPRAGEDRGPASAANVLDGGDDRSSQDRNRDPDRARPAHEEGGGGGAAEPPRRQGPAPPGRDGGRPLAAGDEEMTARA